MPDISNLTEKTLGGNGVLDQLLTTVGLHIDNEYNKSRIKANDYSVVYTSLITAALNAALQHDLQKDLVEAQIAQVEAQTAKEEASTLLINEQRAKLIAETNLLDQKTETERAQTEDVAVPNSVIGKQVGLYTEQTKGYEVDQNVKVAKLFADTLNVQLSTNENVTTSGTGMDNTNIARIMNHTRNSVGA